MKGKPRDTQPVPIAFKPVLTTDEAGMLANLGRQAIYDAINAKKLVARKNGARTLILRTDLDAFITTLPRLDEQETA